MFLRRRFAIFITLIGVLGVYLVLDSRLVTGEDTYEQLGRGFDEINEAYRLLFNQYVDELKPGDLSKAAISGMLWDLDPYTTLFDSSDLKQLQIETQGKFGGLGIMISKRGKDDGPPVVMSVIEGTPADSTRLVVGDRIVAIDGDPTFDKDLREIVDVLRGDPGAGVTIKIERPGMVEPFDQPIIRARIDISSVQIPGEVDPDIGYISMSWLSASRFTERTGGELQQALIRSLNNGATGIILDLRGNPGGLLNAAVDVVDKFLPSDRLVVSTRGRLSDQSRSHKTRDDSILPAEIPLVILVDERSASASEIVAGAIQDWDRGVIVGTQTFGKGSVQTVRQLGHQGDKALKLTTAAYYTPSGRSIHNAEKRRYRGGPIEITVGNSTQVSAYELFGIIGQAERREDVITELEERFDLDKDLAEEVLGMRLEGLLGLATKEHNGPEDIDPEKVFTTRVNKRKVYGGGGIKPDVVVEQERRPRLVIALLREGLIFDFAVDFATRQSFPNRFEDYTLPEDIVAQFWTFMADSANAEGFDYKTDTEIQVQEVKKSLKEKDVLTDETIAALNQLSQAAEREREADYNKAEPYIRLEIERALANRVWGTKGKILATLKGDKQFQEAVRLLKDRAVYAQKLALVEE
ncbi:MAG: S41 family peptidase [Gemmatimonadota bacterium]|nr:S41 family peptidase [Gemmatimonadota bacterium]MDE2954780.1 S41 family peptidase [Gemmatimonadota bacterium]